MASANEIQRIESSVSGIAQRIDAAFVQMQDEDNRLRTQLETAMARIDHEISTGSQRIAHVETAVQDSRPRILHPC